MRRALAAAVFTPFVLATAFAHEEEKEDPRPPRPDGHAPIGVMRDHAHKKGEIMLSYRYMTMYMEGSRIRTNEVSPETIVSTVPNVFAGQPMQPPNLRVVPVDMRMDMHMFGAMWAPSDRVTLMAMVPIITKSMDHITFAGPIGTDRLGRFTTESTGIGDIGFSALVPVASGRAFGADHGLQFNMGFTAPTGSIDESDQILTPTGATPSPTLPYPMQIGTGTFAVKPGFVYTGSTTDWSWGAQYDGTFRLGENDATYRFGNMNEGSAWLARRLNESFSVSLRARGVGTGRVQGFDPRIVAPVQTANPDFQGGTRVDLGAGLNFSAPGVFRGHRLALEVLRPVYQDLNGPQLETDFLLTAGWQWTWN